jgi:DNA-binding winged helix-turn-helix (wHTH) protein
MAPNPSALSDPASSIKKPPLEIIEGGFIYQGKDHKLSGKPLQVLREFLGAKYYRQSAADLQKAVWKDAETGLETIKNAVSDVRKALRQAGIGTNDPIPCVDRGANLAWRLELPT